MHRKLKEKRFEVIQERLREHYEKEGWYLHSTTSKNGQFVNHHTHGLQENFGHPDLQIVLHYHPQQIYQFFHYFSSLIKQGTVFEAGKEYHDTLTYPIRFESFTEGERNVLRVIFCDKEGRFPEEPDCEPTYKQQTAQFQ